MKPMLRNGLIRAGALILLATLAGCTTFRNHWTFTRSVPPPPPPVAELIVGWPQDGTPPVVLQYWERNTLVLDITNVGGQGRITLRPAPEKTWPARLAFRMAPRRFEELEVRGAQRLLLPVAAAGTEAVTAELPAGLYRKDTVELAVSWGASGAF